MYRFVTFHIFFLSRSPLLAGGSIGHRSGGRRDGGGVYPTAAAALGLGLAPHQDLEEKSEIAAAGGASVASGGSDNNILDGSGVPSRRRSGRGTAAVRGSNGSTAATEGGFFHIAASGGVVGAGGPAGATGAPGTYLPGSCSCGAAGGGGRLVCSSDM